MRILGWRWLVLGVSLSVCLAIAALALRAPNGEVAEHHMHNPLAAEQADAAGQVRTYYIAADQVDWDYAPSGQNQITGKPFDDEANVFVGKGPGRIGSTYHKSIYREYTDASFSQLKPRPADEAYLGLLGPVIRAEVGDTIQVVFRNNTPFPASVHPHGVFYDKSSEGAGYQDGTGPSDKEDDAVASGGAYTYTWTVPERAGPGPMDSSTVCWMYHSHVDEPADTNAGLIGPMIIAKRGGLGADGRPKDVDREFIALYTIFDENVSPYRDANIASFVDDPQSVQVDDDGFVESNLMHSINGYVFGNQPMMQMKVGERVRWYVMGMGTEVDVHTPHWHGQTLVINGMRTDVASLLPMEMVTANMVPDNPGIWLFHCHVNDHIKAGMLTRFEVVR